MLQKELGYREANAPSFLAKFKELAELVCYEAKFQVELACWEAISKLLSEANQYG